MNKIKELNEQIIAAYHSGDGKQMSKLKEEFQSIKKDLPFDWAAQLQNENESTFKITATVLNLNSTANANQSRDMILAVNSTFFYIMAMIVSDTIEITGSQKKRDVLIEISKICDDIVDAHLDNEHQKDKSISFNLSQQWIKDYNLNYQDCIALMELTAAENIKITDKNDYGYPMYLSTKRSLRLLLGQLGYYTYSFNKIVNVHKRKSLKLKMDKMIKDIEVTEIGGNKS